MDLQPFALSLVRTWCSLSIVWTYSFLPRSLVRTWCRMKILHSRAVKMEIMLVFTNDCCFQVRLVLLLLSGFDRLFLCCSFRHAFFGNDAVRKSIVRLSAACSVCLWILLSLQCASWQVLIFVSTAEQDSACNMIQ